MGIRFVSIFAMLGPTVICVAAAFLHKKTKGGWGVIACIGLIVGYFGNINPDVRLYATIAYTLSPVTGFLASKIDAFLWKSEPAE